MTAATDKATPEAAALTTKVEEADANHHDIRMVQASERSGLAGKALGKRRVFGSLGRNNLQGYHAIEIFLTGLIHRPHAAAAEKLEDFELRKVMGEGRHVFLRRRLGAC